MTRYQWLVFFAAWLGWGFDVFDGLLFNFVAPICVPQLLGSRRTMPATPARVASVAGIVTSALARRLGHSVASSSDGSPTGSAARARSC